MMILRRPLVMMTVALLLAGCTAGTRTHRASPRPSAYAGQALETDPGSRDSSLTLPFLGEQPDSWWPEDTDSLALETELLLRNLVVPLDSLANPVPDLPDISDSVAAVTKARMPSVDELFDYPVVVNGRVLAWVDAYLGSLRGFFDRSLRRSGRYLAMSRRIFREEGIPQDLAFLAHVESGFRHNARSRAKALGLWQFMRGTAQLYGLRCDSQVDERLDPEKETRAAARYLRDLYALYGDWCLALAAYNAGAGKVNRAIEQTGKRDFWQIATTRHLRDETRNFVPAMMAVTILSKSPNAYGLTMETDPPLEYETVRVDIPTDLRIVARCCGVPAEQVRELNPALLQGQTPSGGAYDVRVPVGTGERFAIQIRKIPAEERLVQVRHTVRRGESLGLIAKRYHTTVRAIQDANRMGRKTLIQTGQTLVIPTRGGGELQASTEKEAGTQTAATHRVRRGESLSIIARRYGVGVRELQAHNHLSNPNRLAAGQVLKIPGAPPAAKSPKTADSAGQTDETSREAPAHAMADERTCATPDAQRVEMAAGGQPMQPGGDCDSPDSLGRVASTAHIVEQARLTCAEEIQEQNVTDDEPASGKNKPESDRTTSEPCTHVVKRGDTLSKIASRYGVTVANLRSWNRLGKRSTIFPRQKLLVTNPGKTGGSTPSSGSDARVHVVRNGDSLWKIARKYGVGVSDLAQWNGIGQRSRIYPGQKLRVH